MKKSNIITIVISAYNHEKTIKKAIESVLNQKTSYSYEIWICEDCSIDRTLTICNKYADKYFNKIKLIAQPFNTQGRHSYEALSKIKTKYYALLDGDDYWLNKNKIQIAIDIMESNSKYVMFAHDTLYNNILNHTKKALVKKILKTKIENPVSIYKAPYLHISSRIYKNIIKFDVFDKNLPVGKDLILFYLMLDKGPLYYYDKIMSVYNITGEGIWSKLTEKDKTFINETLYYKINRLLNYKYDSLFSGKVQKIVFLKIFKKILGIKFGWELYIFCTKNKFFHY